VAGVEEAPDHVDHAADGLGGARLRHRGMHPQRVHVGVEAGQLGVGQLEVAHAKLARLGKDRVVDVGDVADHAHLVAELLEAPDEQVVRQVRGRVAQVGGVVRRDAAHVHAHHRPRLERHDRPLRGVEEAQGHAGPPEGAWPSTPRSRSVAFPR
jgi:hypothetical protein